MPLGSTSWQRSRPCRPARALSRSRSPSRSPTHRSCRARRSGSERYPTRHGPRLPARRRAGPGIAAARRATPRRTFGPPAAIEDGRASGRGPASTHVVGLPSAWACRRSGSVDRSRWVSLPPTATSRRPARRRCVPPRERDVVEAFPRAVPDLDRVGRPDRARTPRRPERLRVIDADERARGCGRPHRALDRRPRSARGTPTSDRCPTRSSGRRRS